MDDNSTMRRWHDDMRMWRHEFRIALRLLGRPQPNHEQRIVDEWMAAEIAPGQAAEWHARGYLPDEAAPFIAAGAAPKTIWGPGPSTTDWGIDPLPAGLEP
ncbi:hypothetical protein ACQPZJ_01675 [Actinoplanes sp. CA-054009]